MPLQLNRLSSTVTIGGKALVLKSDEFDPVATKADIQARMQQGISFSTGEQRLSATLGEILVWIKDFESTLELPDILGDITGSTTLDHVAVVINSLSVTFSTVNPKFSIDLEVDFDQGFYDSLDVPGELTKWFTVDSMGISLSYAKGT